MIASLRKTVKKIIAALLLLTTEALFPLILFAAALIVFILIAKYVFLDKKQEFDQEAFMLLDAFISDSNSYFMSFITQFGNYQFLVAANLLLIVYFLFIRRHKWYSIKIPAVAFGSVAIMLILKHWFNRPRPDIPLLEPALGLSFPSGHAMNSVTFYGLLIYFIWKQRRIDRATRIMLVAVLVTLILLIGLSRVYLRVHYASDVIGGFCSGIIWLFISINLINRIQRIGKKELDPLVKESPKV